MLLDIVQGQSVSFVEWIEGFEFLTQESYETELWKKHFERKEITYDEYNKEYNKQYEEAEKKAILFIKYFNSLWD